jgi:hypothetical protein
MSLQGAITWITAQALTVTGVGAAPDYPTEGAGGVNLWVIAYPAAGEIGTISAGMGKDLDTIQIQILTYRGNSLKEAMYRLTGFPHAIARKIQADPTMNGNVSTYRDMTYNFVASEWGGVPVVGYALNINQVKTNTTY